MLLNLLKFLASFAVYLFFLRAFFQNWKVKKGATLVDCQRAAKTKKKLDGSLPANPVNDRRIANGVTLKSTFCLP